MKKLLACLLVPLTALALGACKPAATSSDNKPVELNWQQPKLTSNVWKISKEANPIPICSAPSTWDEPIKPCLPMQSNYCNPPTN